MTGRDWRQRPQHSPTHIILGTLGLSIGDRCKKSSQSVGIDSAHQCLYEQVHGTAFGRFQAGRGLLISTLSMKTRPQRVRHTVLTLTCLFSLMGGVMGSSITGQLSAQAQSRPAAGTVYVLNGERWQEAFILQAAGRIAGGAPSWSYTVQYFDGDQQVERQVNGDRVRTIDQAQAEGLTDNVYDLSSPTGIDQILATHNEARRQVGVSDLAWSGDLADSAQAWAETLIARDRVEHSPSDVLQNANRGENIAAYRTTGRSASYTAATRAAQGWVDERVYYDSAANRCASGQLCGHYTQVVWANTTAVGCGMARSADEKQEVWVCHYNPGGNVVGQRPY